VAALQELAHVAGGEYIELNSQALSQTLVDRLLSDLDRHRAESRQITRPVDRFQLPLAAGILCIAMSLIIRPSSRRVARSATPLPVNPQSTVHRPAPLPPPLPAAGLTAVGLLMFLVLGLSPAMAASRAELSAARRSYDDGHYDHSRDAYKRMSMDKEASESADEAYYGLGASNFMLRDYEAADRAFSDALKSNDPAVRLRAQRGLATALYDKGDLIMAKQPERTIKAWTDSRDHFDSGMKIAKEGTPEYNELKENRDFVQKRLDDLKKQQAEKENQQKEAGDKNQKGKGKGESKGDANEQDKGEKGEGDPKGGEKKTDAMQKQEAVPEGEIRAGEAGKPDEKEVAGEEDAKRNDKTGFTPQEARSQLRNYADDQKSVQYLMRDEKPSGGKDY
jgi:Ca-activated chloride channel family protein